MAGYHADVNFLYYYYHALIRVGDVHSYMRFMLCALHEIK